MTFEAIPDEIRANPEAMRAWAQSQSVGDLVAMAEAGYLNTDALRTGIGPLDPHTGRPMIVEVNPILAEQVDAMLRMRHDHAQLVAGLAGLDEKNVGVAMFLPGVDDLKTAVATLVDDAAEEPLVWHLEGDVLYVEGRTSERVAEALRATRP